jgi:DNA-binding transcriptional LysR family regulator
MTAEAANSVTGGTEMFPEVVLGRARGPNWDDYRIFGTVAKERSLGRAAKALGVAKPTIRRRIASLESSIGTSLVDRSASGVALTKQGRQVADMVEAMAMIADSAMTRVRIGEREAVGECKMVLGEGLSTAWFIPHFLGLFGELYPRVVVHLAAAPDNDKISVPPFDIQVRYAPASDDNLMTFRVATFHFNYFASRRYMERFGLPVSQEELGNHRLIDVTRSFGGDTGLMAQYSNIAALGRSYLFSNSGNMVLQSVLAGHVIGLLPSYTFVVSPDLVPILPDCHYETGLFIYFSDSASGKKATRAMIDFLRNIVFDKQRMPWFADRYEKPNESWRAIFADLVDAAGRYILPAGKDAQSE